MTWRRLHEKEWPEPGARCRDIQTGTTGEVMIYERKYAWVTFPVRWDYGVWGFGTQDLTEIYK